MSDAHHPKVGDIKDDHGKKMKWDGHHWVPVAGGDHAKEKEHHKEHKGEHH